MKDALINRFLKTNNTLEFDILAMEQGIEKTNWTQEMQRHYKKMCDNEWHPEFNRPE